MNILKLLFFSLIFTTANAQKINFPHDYVGIWKGTLEIHGVSGMRNVPIELHIVPTNDPARWAWKTIYDNKDVRDYVLVVLDAEKGKYQIDEDNGIIFDMRLFGNKSFICFEVKGYYLYESYIFNEDSIFFELTSSSPQQVTKSGKGTEDSPTVTSYPQVAYQKALLKKD